jgi:integrase
MLRIDGPYRHGRRYRLRIRENGVQRMESFEKEVEAVARMKKLQRAAMAPLAVTVAEALEAYEEYLKAKGNKPRSVEVTQQRLKVMFREFLTGQIGVMVDAKKQLADSLDQYRSLRGEPLSVDSKHNLVNQGRTFLQWCVGKELLKLNPLVGVHVVGRRRRGKPQLTADEGVRFLSKALELADEAIAGRRTGRRMVNMNQLEGSIAAACCLWLGPRASEVSERVVRDLDCHGTVLIIPESKTMSGIRRLNIPAQLQPHLLRLAEGRGPHEKLFGRLADRCAIYR